MPFVPATNVIQCEMIYTWDAQTCENVIHYQRGGGVTTQAMLDAGAALVAFYNGFLKVLTANNASLVEVRMTDLTTEFAPGLSYTTSLPIPGTSALASLPNNVSLSLTKRTLFRGRAYRGRIYAIGITEAHVTANLALSAYTTPLLAAWQGVKTLTLDGVVSPMVVVSRFQGKVARGAALVTPVSDISTDSVIDSQRRRLPKRGA